MANRFEKKELERRAANLVFEACGLDPGILNDGENPDFVFPMDGERIGLEIGRLIKSKDAANDDFGRQAIVDAAQREHAALGGPPLQVWIGLGMPAPGTDRKFVAKQIARMVFDTAPTLDRHYFWHWRDAEHGTYPDCLWSIISRRLVSNAAPLWTNNMGGFPDSGLMDAVRALLAKKESRLPDYLNRCARCWLALVASSEAGTMMFECTPDAAKLEVATRFERVFFVDLFAAQVEEWRRCDKFNGDADG